MRYEIAYARENENMCEIEEVVILLQEQDSKHHCRTTCALKGQIMSGTSCRDILRIRPDKTFGMKT